MRLDRSRRAASETRTVRCKRRYSARPAAVFRAFTEPDLITRWWSPAHDVAVEVLNFDCRVGGHWRFAYRFPDDRVITVGGAFREVTPARRLVFTWTWEPPDVHAGIETLVTVSLKESPGGTTVEVLHEAFPDDATRDRHDQGWRATLARLVEVLT